MQAPNPCHKLQWSYRALRFLFNAIFNDIFASVYRVKLGFVFMVIAWTFVLVNYVYTLGFYENKLMFMGSFAYCSASVEV